MKTTSTFTFLCSIFSFFILSCGTRSTQNERSEESKGQLEKSPFQEVCATLPKVNLPFSVYCENCCEHPESSYQRVIQRYLPEGSVFVGIIEQTDEFISILTTYPADMIIPAVVVFDIEGEKIDEEVFLGGYCGSDYGYFSKQYFYIPNERDLVEIDSMFTLDVDPETFKTRDTTKTETEVKKFTISAKGIEKRN